MPVLTKPQHEQFAQLFAAGKSSREAYQQVYGSSKGADQSASRLLKSAKVSARVAELGQQISSKLHADGLRDRDFRLEQLEARYKLLLQVVQERGLEYQGLHDLAAIVDLETGLARPEEAFQAWRRQYPLLSLGIKNEAGPIASLLRDSAAGGRTGFMVRDYKGLGALQPVYKVDTGLLSELRAIEEQAAREMGQRLPFGGGDGDVPLGGQMPPIAINIAFVSPPRG